MATLEDRLSAVEASIKYHDDMIDGLTGLSEKSTKLFDALDAKVDSQNSAMVGALERCPLRWRSWSLR